MLNLNKAVAGLSLSIKQLKKKHLRNYIDQMTDVT